MKNTKNKSEKGNSYRRENSNSLYKRLLSFLLIVSLSVSISSGIFVGSVFAEGEEVVVSEPTPTVSEPVQVEQVATPEPTPEPAIETTSDVPVSVEVTTYSTSDIQPTGSSDLLESTIDPVDVVGEAPAEEEVIENTGSEGGGTDSTDSSGSSSENTEATVENDQQYNSVELLEDAGQVKGTSTTDLESDSETKEGEDDKVEVEEVSGDVEVENYTDYDAKTKKAPRVKIKKSSLSPSKEFKITLTGRRVATKITTMSGDASDLGPNTQSKKDKNGKETKENRSNLYTVSEADIKLVNSSPNAETGEVFVEKISVSGACSQKYYVILLYKNLSDYEENPSSYILNKAFECTGGTYSYNIDDLPSGLEKGPYYLLVGQQEDGPWTPLSSINEIVID